MATSSKDVGFAKRLENAVDSLLDRITKHAKLALDIDGDKEVNYHKKIKNVARAILAYKSRNFMEHIDIRELLKIADEWRTHMDETLKTPWPHPWQWPGRVIPKLIPALFMLYDLNIIECLMVITWKEVNSGELEYDILKEPDGEVKTLMTRSTTRVRKGIELFFEFENPPFFMTGNMSLIQAFHDMDIAASEVLSGDDPLPAAQLVDLTHQLNDWVISGINTDPDYRKLQIPKVNIPFKRRLTLHMFPLPYGPLFGTSKSSDHDNDDTEPIVRKELRQTHIEEIER